MDAATETRLFEKEIIIDATPETIWELLVDPTQIIRWMGQVATFEAHRGGRYRLEVIPGHVASGEFVELDAPRRLVYTWGWEDANSSVPPGSTTVIFELMPRGNGTLLRLSHHDLPTPQTVASHAHGWQHYLDRLTLVAAGADPGPDPWIDGPMS